MNPSIDIGASAFVVFYHAGRFHSQPCIITGRRTTEYPKGVVTHELRVEADRAGPAVSWCPVADVFPTGDDGADESIAEAERRTTEWRQHSAAGGGVTMTPGSAGRGDR